MDSHVKDFTGFPGYLAKVYTFGPGERGHVICEGAHNNLPSVAMRTENFRDDVKITHGDKGRLDGGPGGSALRSAGFLAMFFHDTDP